MGPTEEATDAFLRDFGRRLRAERVRQRLSQEQLAERAGVHRTAVGYVERGARRVSIAKVHHLAEALSLPAWTLFTDEQQPTR